MEKEYLYCIIGTLITLLVLFIIFWMFWYEDRRQRYIIYKKRFYDRNGIKPSKKYIKDINRFLDIIITIILYDNNNNAITENQLLELEDLYKKIFMKGVKAIYKFNYAIDICAGYEKSYIDKAMKQIRSEYKTWQKFDNTEEIY